VFAQAQTAALPRGNLTLVVPFAAGGATDVVSRLIAQKLGERIARTVVVENLGGGGGSIGAAKVAKATADGSVLLMGTIATHVINPLSATQAAQATYDPQRDFTPISLLAKVSNVLLVGNAVKAQNLRELIALIKSQPGKFSYGSSGIGTPPHLSGELFKAMAGLDIAHVPSFPDIPTMAEAGLPGYETYTWNAIFGPAGVPRPVVDTLSRELVAVVALPEVQAKLKELSATPVGSTPKVLAALGKSDLDKMGALIKSIGGLKRE
jgi:tripartite-type tricarboxylate transporter receptor subunit TctC